VNDGRLSSSLELMSVLGHELRRPLTVIRGAATLLVQSRNEMPEETVSQLLHLIDAHTLAMSDQIEDLLTLTHLEAGDLEVYPSDAEVSAIVDPVVESARRSEDRAIHVLGSAPGLSVHADSGRAAQALRQLISNALRYSPSDAAVEVAIQAEPELVRFEVLDRGPGVPPEQRQTVFDRFAKLGDRGGGLGIGLHLARGLVEAMGGRIGVNPRPGGGSAFWFTLSRRG
jgi:signal transduction histidine kinase